MAPGDKVCVDATADTPVSVPASIEMRLARRALFWLIGLSLCCALGLTYLSVRSFKQILLPEVLAKTHVIGDSVRATVEHALGLGIPFAELAGMNDYLDDTLLENPEIAFIRVTGPGTAAFGRGDSGGKVITQLIPASASGAAVTLGVRASYLSEKLYLLYGDVAAILIVALVAGLEVALFFSFRWLIGPLDTWRAMIAGALRGELGRGLRRGVSGPFAGLLQMSERNIARLRGALPAGPEEWYRPAARDVRVALFLYVLSEELLRSFFPLYVKEIIGVSSPLGLQLAISAPLIAYMLFAGIGNVVGAGLIERLGLRRGFGISVLMTTLSLCGLAAASSLAEVIAWRSLAALGYALATITCQVFITRTLVPGAGGARGLSVFVAAVTAACICGAPIGAVLADIFGKPVAMLCAAAVALLSWLLFRGVALPETAAPAPAEEQGGKRQGHLRALSGHRRIVLLLCCAVAPSKMLLTGLLFFITPLLLQQLGVSQSSIGQYFILFYVLLLGGNAMSAHGVSGPRTHTRMVVCGALVSGAGALLLLWFQSPLVLAAAIVCFGFGQSITQTPVSALLLHIVRSDLPQVPPSRLIGLSRIFERGGSICGAVGAAILAASYGYAPAAAMMGAAALVLGLGTLPLLREPAAASLPDAKDAPC